jgi:hypothetical protein
LLLDEACFQEDTFSGGQLPVISPATMVEAFNRNGEYLHDTYHTGQIEILRQASGKNDKII